MFISLLEKQKTGPPPVFRKWRTRMDPDDHEPAGAPVPEGRARREHTALETKRTVSELLLRVEDHADLSTLKHGSLTAVSKLFHVSARKIKRTW